MVDFIFHKIVQLGPIDISSYRRRAQITPLCGRCNGLIYIDRYMGPVQKVQCCSTVSGLSSYNAAFQKHQGWTIISESIVLAKSVTFGGKRFGSNVVNSVYITSDLISVNNWLYRVSRPVLLNRPLGMKTS